MHLRASALFEAIRSHIGRSRAWAACNPFCKPFVQYAGLQRAGQWLRVMARARIYRSTLLLGMLCATIAQHLSDNSRESNPMITQIAAVQALRSRPGCHCLRCEGWQGSASCPILSAYGGLWLRVLQALFSILWTLSGSKCCLCFLRA